MIGSQLGAGGEIAKPGALSLAAGQFDEPFREAAAGIILGRGKQRLNNLGIFPATFFAKGSAALRS